MKGALIDNMPINASSDGDHHESVCLSTIFFLW